MLMAGLDGIKNKLHPGDAMDKDLYELPAEELAQIPTVAGSLREALDALNADRSFLTEGGVFTDDQIDAYIELKMEEVINLEHTHLHRLNSRCTTHHKPNSLNQIISKGPGRKLSGPFFLDQNCFPSPHLVVLPHI